MNMSKLKQAEEAFLHRYPGGFDNPELIAIRDRKHKPDKMIALAQGGFSKGNFRLPDQIVENMIKIINRSSVISMFEKPRFRDFANGLSPQEKDFLSNGLKELLYGEEQTGFEMILDLLKSEKLGSVCKIASNG